MIEYDDKLSRNTERMYLAPAIARQRLQTLDALNPRAGAKLLDVGCGPGLLVHDMAHAVGEGGQVIGVDMSQQMLDLAARRCAGLPQVRLESGSAEQLPLADSTVDGISCVQVLLYVPDPRQALAEMSRVLKPGGRLAIIETDWRGVLLHSSDPALSAKMLQAWDHAVPHPQLVPQLQGMLRQQGFTIERIEAIPIVSNDYNPQNFAAGSAEWMAELALAQGIVDPGEVQAWLADIAQLGAAGEFFFCVNRFLFIATHP
jgi:arsenite methyltransferase